MKKLVSVLLLLCMIFAAFPITASAPAGKISLSVTADKLEEIKPGDIVFVHPGSTGDPLHVYMVASTVSRGNALRYDHGSDSRIMSNQPTSEPVSYGDAPFMYAYRPVVTEENNIYYNELYANADKQP